MLPADKKLCAVNRGLSVNMPPTEIISDLGAQGFSIDECHNMANRKTGEPMPLFLFSIEKTEKHKTAFKTITNIGYVKFIVEIQRKKIWTASVLRMPGFFHSSTFCTRTTRCVKCTQNHLAKDCPKPIEKKPKFCLCEGEHPANFLGCPKNPRHRIAEEKEKKKQKSIHVVPEPPKMNFWEQQEKTAAQSQQSTTSAQPKPTNPSPASPSSHSNNRPDCSPDIFNQLRNPAVQETFDLLEKFVEIATTIPTKYGRLRAISKLLEDEITI
ncbi:hypothetical protein TNIN_203431 [Trichonephila inaurata madagascariensis]|uniref:Pre-C2HC domain-containing protein n=1 Tax=Trichonephila inaurata madagascariensis TaxID=2747483 RepID=A0A8X7CI53_9ARAC|nr:hypothetical protein TNIN_203431 [Trichonephila inaurata madagascariensis]